MSVIAITLLSCSNLNNGKDRLEPTFIEVSGALIEATAEDSSTPAEYTNSGRSMTLSGSALDRNAEPYSYDGWVEISARPGRIASLDGGLSVEDKWGDTHWYLQANQGQIETTVEVASAFGDTRLWITATADPTDDTSVGSLATGVTEPISIHLPTIQQLQDVSEIDDDEPHTTSPLFGEFVTVRTSDRQVVVTELDTKGFWVSDLGHIDDPPATVSDAYRGLFVYTFNAPENIAIGDRLELLGGGVQEYIGTTQLSFPIYQAMDDEQLPVPGSAVLNSDSVTAESACQDNNKPNHSFLETLESSLVTVTEGTIPEDFQEMPPGQDSHPDFASFLEYGQWPIVLDSGCTMQVVSNIAVPQFDPVENAGQRIGPISGMLKFVEAGGDRWVIQVVNSDDMPFFESDPTAKTPPTPSRSHWDILQTKPSLEPLCDHDHVGDHLRPHKD